MNPGKEASIACPVPPEQRPQEEYAQLCSSWFFAWPCTAQVSLDRALLISWLLISPITVLVASGSWTLRHDPVRLLIAGGVATLVLPMLLLTRQWLGWTYVHKHLLSNKWSTKNRVVTVRSGKNPWRGVSGIFCWHSMKSVRFWADLVVPWRW